MISAVPKMENILIVNICPYTVLNFSAFGFPHQSEWKFNSPSLPVYSPFHQKYCLKQERDLIICPCQTPVGLPCDQHSAGSNKDPFAVQLDGQNYTAAASLVLEKFLNLCLSSASHMFLNAFPSYMLHKHMQTLLTSPLLCAVWPGL